MIKKIILLFNAKEKMDFFFIQFLIIISAFLEMSTVVAIVPMMNVFIDKNYIFKNEYILSIYNYFNFNDPNLFSIYFVSSIVLLFFEHFHSLFFKIKHC